MTAKQYWRYLSYIFAFGTALWGFLFGVSLVWEALVMVIIMGLCTGYTVWRESNED
jgi:hypothetical protein